MSGSGKSLQLVIFTVEGKKSRTLLDDSLAFSPDYRVGEVIHIVPLSSQTITATMDRQYVVRSVKHIITTTDTDVSSHTYVLLVEVAEIFATEREDVIGHTGSRPI